MKNYGYEVSNKFHSILNFPIVFILIILPLRYELNVLIFRLSNDKGLSLKIYNIARFGFHYLRRVKNFYKYLFRRLFNRDFIGNNLYQG